MKTNHSGNNNDSNKKELNKNFYLNFYNKLPLIEKITIKNKINKIISAYRIYSKRKNVSTYK
jgi:hypothetical protein